MRSGSEFQTEVPEYGILNRGMGVDFGVEVGIGVHLIFFSENEDGNIQARVLEFRNLLNVESTIPVQSYIWLIMC